MSTQFGRRAVVIVDSLKVEGLRVQFKAEKSVKAEPNTLDLQITNLKRETRARMQTKSAKVIVLAGYGLNVRQVFSGDARTIDHVRQEADWTTRIQCGDGERAYSNGRISASFGPGTALVEVVGKITSAMGLGLGNAVEEISKGDLRGSLDQFVNGIALAGKGETELDRVLTSAGFEWSIQDGQLRLLRPGKTTTETAVVLTPDSGLIGSPQHGTPNKKGLPSVLKVRCLLRPEIEPGRRLVVRASDVNGTFRAEKITHLGDTAGQEWYTDLECLPL